MPWHDVSLALVGDAVLDISRHFCERWNFIKKQKYMTKDSLPFLRPPLGGLTNAAGFGDTNPLSNEYTKHFRSRRIVVPNKNRSTNDHVSTPANMSVQVLRSSSEWSHMISTEHSIQNAYIELIEKSEHFVYIENQFFITANDDQENVVKNKIGQAIVKRIIRARDEGKNFRVIVLMPLLPAFASEISTKDAATLRLIINLQYKSICRGGNSILEKLAHAGISDPSKYIAFFGLRSYDRIKNDSSNSISKDILDGLSTSIAHDALLDGNLTGESIFQGVNANGIPIELENYVSEILYIHTKLMIVDDRYVICGSANLNDRSQNGDHDSEIAVCIEDHDLVESVMDGHVYKASRYATTLRRQLMREHLGLINNEKEDICTNASFSLPDSDIFYPDLGNSEMDQLVQDPLSQEFWDMWIERASNNTKIFRDLFHVVPDDSVTSWDEYHKYYPAPGCITTGHLYQTRNSNEDGNNGKDREVNDSNSPVPVGTSTPGMHPDNEVAGGFRGGSQILESRQHIQANSARFMDVNEVRGQLTQIRGHLVEFPLHFLEKEELMHDTLVTNLTIDLYT